MCSKLRLFAPLKPLFADGAVRPAEDKGLGPHGRKF